MIDNIKLLNKINENNSRLISSKVATILIVYDRPGFWIGDTCVQLSRLKKLHLIYENAVIDMNTIDPKLHKLTNTILLNSPYIRKYSNDDWINIAFENYDLVICGCVPEKKFVDFLFQNYSAEIAEGTFPPAIYTASGSIGFNEFKDPTTFFPLFQNFIKYSLSEADSRSMRANEMFISYQEQRWADNWLIDQGISNDENLIIFIDNSSSRNKLLKMPVYFEILSIFIRTTKNRILIFDEQKIGKRDFYNEWLGNELAKKIIFAEGLGLREAMCLLSSSFVKFIFGPSTGLLHCASGIYNIFSQREQNYKPPVMIGYLGGEEKTNYEESEWWGGSLVDMILPIRKDNGAIEVHSIKEIAYDQLKSTNRILSCSEFTAELIMNYIQSKYSEDLYSAS